MNLTKDKESLWAKDLFAARAVYHGVRDNPMIFFDPLSTNKIYRREFLDRHGIRFPEGVHYEDSLFSTKVYCLAETIAIIPNLVYLWRVVEDAEERSITQRRYEFENFRDRVAVHRMMDTFLREHDSADLKVYKDFKFVRHDLKLYLTDLAHRDEEYQHKFMRLAADYCATISDETLAMVYPLERICVHLIRRLDVAETLRPSTTSATASSCRPTWWSATARSTGRRSTSTRPRTARSWTSPRWASTGCRSAGSTSTTR